MNRDNIINDLMRRRPKGPGRVKIDYTFKEEYCYRARKYKKIPEPSLEQYGYTSDELFDLGFKSKESLREYIRERDFEGKSDYILRGRKSTLSRRTSAVWSRIEGAVRALTRTGGVGIYSVHRLYHSGRMGHVYARTIEEATETANLFFGYLCPDKDVSVKFMKLGSVQEIYELNRSAAEKIEVNISRSEAQIKEEQARIERYRATLMTLNMVETQQVAIETVNDISAATAA